MVDDPLEVADTLEETAEYLEKDAYCHGMNTAALRTAAVLLRRMPPYEVICALKEWGDAEISWLGNEEGHATINDCARARRRVQECVVGWLRKT